MKTVTTTTVHTNVDQFTFGYWDSEAEQFVPLKTQKDLEQAAKVLGCSVGLLEMLEVCFDEFRRAVSCDLRDVWARLDQLEDVEKQPKS